MSPELQGVIELNALFAITGLALLAGLRGWRTWLELLDSLGLALLLGTSAVAVLATLVLIAGGGLPTWTILGLAAAVAIPGVILSVVLRRPLPSTLGVLPRLSLGTGVAAVGAAGLLAILVELFRLARVMPLGGGDSFEDWVPRAKIIYFFGKIDTPLFTGLPGPRYPILVPTLQAMDFRFMGSGFGPELAVEYWFLFAGFAFAASFILRRIAPAWLVWPFVALTAVLPQLVNRVLNAQADWALDVFFVVAALVAVAWLREGGSWLLVSLGILLAAVIATKQEGLLLAGCLYIGLGAGHDRVAAPDLAAAHCRWACGVSRQPAVADLVGHDGTCLTSLPTVGLRDLLTHLHRGWASLHLVLRLTFDYGMWFALVPVALLAAAAALTPPRPTARDRARLPRDLPDGDRRFHLHPLGRLHLQARHPAELDADPPRRRSDRPPLGDLRAAPDLPAAPGSRTIPQYVGLPQWTPTRSRSACSGA